MQLSKRSDQGLRLLMYLCLTQGRYVSMAEVAERFNIPESNLRKITPEFVEAGWVTTQRGPHGGVQLAVDPNDISVGAVVRQLETFHMLECFEDDSSCPADGCCSLTGVVSAATHAFLTCLDGATVADVTTSRTRFARTLGLQPSA